ncbi:hypothetical protein PN465_23320 [Nodularia spumigena CS-584]|nr:hypothetical protein [Nodularia spumigena CS-584]
MQIREPKTLVETLHGTSIHLDDESLVFSGNILNVLTTNAVSENQAV